MPRNGNHITLTDDDLGGQDEPEVYAASNGANEVAEDIRSKIRAVSGHELGTQDINLGTVNKIVETVFWWPARGRLFVLVDGALKEVSKTEVGLLLRKTFNQIVDPAAMQEAIARCKDSEKKQGQCAAAPAQAVLNYAICRRQCSRIDWNVDMFGEKDRVEIDNNAARIVLTHRQFDEGLGFNPQIIDDYKKHFPRFDEFLDLLVAARFASCRKTAYLWIYADSNWGKGLLLDRVIGGLRDGVAVNLSVTEIEAIFEGKPAAKAPENFTHALALVVNEFKAVKAELKQIENNITIAPKYQMASKVPIYTKVFLSAENVESLVTQNGVEDQFANRINLFEERGDIEDREIFQEYGKDDYARNLRDYAAARINKLVGEYQREGRAAATRKADTSLADFFSKYTISKKHKKFSETFPQVAQDCIDWITRKYPPNVKTFDDVKVLHSGKDGSLYLRNPSKHIDTFLETHYPLGEVKAYRRRRAEIAKHMSVSGEGMKEHKLQGLTVKCIKLKPASQEKASEGDE